MGWFDDLLAPTGPSATTQPVSPYPAVNRLGLFGATLSDAANAYRGQPSDQLAKLQQMMQENARWKQQNGNYQNIISQMSAPSAPNPVTVTPQIQPDATGAPVPNDPSSYQQPAMSQAGPLAGNPLTSLLKNLPADQGMPTLMSMMGPHGFDTVTDAQGVVHKIDKVTGADLGTIGSPKLQEIDPTKNYYQPGGTSAPQATTPSAQPDNGGTQAISDAFSKAPPAVQQAIQSISDPNLRTFAAYMGKGESGFNPTAVNPKNPGVAGLFQFDIPTWKIATGQTIPANVAGTPQDPRLDPKQAAQAFQALTQRNAQSFQSTFGRQPDAGDLAVYHQQGAGGGSALIGADPNALAVQVLAKSIVQSTPGITPQQAQSIATKRMTSNGVPANATAGQMLGIVKNYYVPQGSTATPSSAPQSSAPNIPGMTLVSDAKPQWRTITDPGEARQLGVNVGSQKNDISGEVKPMSSFNMPVQSDDPTVKTAGIQYFNTGVMPTGISRNPQRAQAIMSAAHDYGASKGLSDGDIATTMSQNAQNYKSGQTALTNFDQGKLGNQTRSFSVGLSHLDTLTHAVNALGNGDNQTFNAVKNTIANWTGKAAPSNFNGVRDIVADEIVKAVVGSSGGVGDREGLKSTISQAQSPQQLLGIIGKYKELMAGQLRGLQQQYQVSTGRNDFTARLSPAAQTLLNPPQRNGAPINPASLPRVGGNAPTIIKYDAQGNRIP